MKLLDILTGKFTTVICEPVGNVSKKIMIITDNDKFITDNFFVSYSKPCFSSRKTMFINFKEPIPINKESVIEFIT